MRITRALWPIALLLLAAAVWVGAHLVGHFRLLPI